MPQDKYPRGKISDDDEGDLTIAISAKAHTLMMIFGLPVKWIGMDKETALAIGKDLIEKASKL